MICGRKEKNLANGGVLDAFTWEIKMGISELRF